MKSTTVSLIVPNWNGLTHLKTCFDSVTKQTLQVQETIMVDNGSTDRSVDFVKREYPWVTVIPLANNTGFAFAVNRGIEAAHGEFIGFLNNDTELDRYWLERLVQKLSSLPALGSVACKMVNFDRHSIIDSAGDGVTPFATPYNRGRGEFDAGQYDTEEFVFGVCAGAALYRRLALDAIGRLDEEFVSYYEDVDLSFRAQLAGYKCLYVPGAVCYHKRGATGGKESALTVRMAERNLTAYYVKDIPTSILLERSPLILASRARRLFREIMSGNGGAACSGLLEGLTLIPRMLTKRRQVQSSRNVSIQYIKSLMKKGNRG